MLDIEGIVVNLFAGVSVLGASRYIRLASRQLPVLETIQPTTELFSLNRKLSISADALCVEPCG